MSETNIQYWPFPVPLAEHRTEVHRQQIGFLEVAFADGFRPRQFTDVMLDGEFLAENEAGRSGLILFRGRNRWEVSLGVQTTRVHAFWVDGFDSAAGAVLAWLRGGTAADVQAAVDGHVIRGAVVANPVTVSESATP